MENRSHLGRSHRRAPLLLVLVAGEGAVIVALLLSGFLDDRWPAFAFFELDRPASTVSALFLTTGTAIQAATAPHLTAPMRKIGWTFILTAQAASVLGAVTTVSDVLGALLVGLFLAAKSLIISHSSWVVKEVASPHARHSCLPAATRRSRAFMRVRACGQA